MPVSPRSRSILLALAGIAVVLLGGEVVVRLLLASPSPVEPSARFEYQYRPFTRVVTSYEGYSVQRTNSLGLFDDELRVPRPARRVLLVGDSYAEGLQVPHDSAFAAVAERLLPGTEIVNAGQGGASLLDDVEWVELHGPAIAPDVIVLEVADANLELLLKPATLARFASPPRPGVIEPPPVLHGFDRLLFEARRNSALFTLASRRLKLLLNEQRTDLSRRFRESKARKVVRLQTVAVNDARMPGILDTLYQRLAKFASHVVIVYVPNLDYFSPGLPESDPRLAHLLRDVCARHGGTLLDAGAAMREEFRRTGQPLQGFPNSVVGQGHINVAGHRVVGELLARALAEPAS